MAIRPIVVQESKHSTTDRFHTEPKSFYRKFNDSWQTVYIALGSNQGDSTAHLIQARSFLQEISTSLYVLPSLSN